MNTLSRTHLLSALIVAMLPFAVQASGVVVITDAEPFEGHHYKVIKANAIDWNSANAAAMNSEFMGVTGRLATITSAAEDLFIEQLRAAALGSKEAWVGGRQDKNLCTAAQLASPTLSLGCGWIWNNSEGSISTPQVPLPSYSNWQPNEPNDLGSEMYLGVGLNGEFGWNDEQALSLIGGYVIEFDTVVPVTGCVGGTGCPTATGPGGATGQTLTYPPVAGGPDASLGVVNYDFMDPRFNGDGCDQEVLTLFTSDNVAGVDTLQNDLIIPSYLCGSPGFRVVAIDSTDIEVQNGTIFVENEVLALLPNNLYECTGPKGVVPPVDLDPQHRDVVSWQSTNPDRMLEGDIGPAFGFPGALTELTNSCGSSRGRVKGSSYYVIGMHIDFGDGYGLSENAAGNNEKFIALTRFKLEVLEQSVQNSQVALSRFEHFTLRFLVKTAVRLHDRNYFKAALGIMNLFEAIADVISYDVVPGENYNGDHLMRSDNIQFMYTDKILPFSP